MTDNKEMADKSQQSKPDKEPRITIRGIDPELYKLARIEALKQDVTVGEWINQLMGNKLNKPGKRR